jgi:3-oxoacyl-[acyl-carrier protein] reductase
MVHKSDKVLTLRVVVCYGFISVEAKKHIYCINITSNYATKPFKKGLRPFSALFFLSVVVNDETMMTLAGKKALVTGATGGIGQAIVQALLVQGAEVAISGTSAEKLAALHSTLRGKIVALPCRLDDAEAVAALVPQAEEALGGLDVLVNNAGITRDGLAMRMKDEDWQAVLDINLGSAFRLSRAVLRGMMKQRSGRIINITSVVGVMGNAGQANYCAAKAGLIGMSKALAAEVASRGITVNCVAPGFIKTPMTDALDEKQSERITANIPAGRFGLPEDIAAGVAFLASDAASYITGQTLHINGGLLMV